MAFAVLTLRDPETGTRAQILPEFGFNCYRLVVDDDGEPVELLWADPDLESGNARPSGSGIPLLFPFPGRLPGGTAAFQGKQYELPHRDALGNAIHGYVLNRAWKVLHQDVSSVTARFDSTDHPELQTQWPADFRIIATYRVQGKSLRGELLVENPGETPLPWGLGLHPYFSVPLGSGGKAADCRVQVPVREHWPLKDMLPSGERVSLPPNAPLAQGMPFAETHFDDVFSGVAIADGRCAASVSDPATRRRLELQYDSEFPVCVVYNPPHRQAVCIEPYTCVPGLPMPANPQSVGPGLQMLPPGEQRRLNFEIRLTSLD